MKFLKNKIHSLLDANGYVLKKKYDIDVPQEFIDLHTEVSSITMTSQERQYALYKAVAYLTQNSIEGDIVECGVWKGGSSVLIAKLLERAGDTKRSLYLYDTFSGMPAPGSNDISWNGVNALGRWKDRQKGEINTWDYASLDEVKRNMYKTQYPEKSIHFIQGKVEETIPRTAPATIALLRLDTDWYESTRHELEHLFPRIVPGGVLIIDDYGHWKGVQKAVDEYFSEKNIRIFLNRIDYTGRIGIK